MCLKEMSILEQKQQIIIEWLSGQYSAIQLGIRHGVSTPTIYNYIHRYEINGFDGLLNKSRRPKNSPNSTNPKLIAKIIELKKIPYYSNWGGKKLIIKLRDFFPIEEIPSRTTLQRILKRLGLVKKQRRKKRPENTYPKFESTTFNEIWNVDFKGEFPLGNKRKCYALTITDNEGRFIIEVKGLHSIRGSYVKPVFIRIFKQFGLPKKIHTDNGIPFACINSLGRFTKLAVWFMELGIQPVFSDPGHPEQNPRHERMHKDLKDQTTRPPGFNMQAQQRKFNKFKEIYNHERPHESLDMKTPAEVYKKSSIEYPLRILPFQYPAHFIQRRVCMNGQVRIGKANWLPFSTAFNDKILGFEEIGNKIYKVFFRQFFIAYADINSLKVYDIMTYKNELKL